MPPRVIETALGGLGPVPRQPAHQQPAVDADDDQRHRQHPGQRDATGHRDHRRHQQQSDLEHREDEVLHWHERRAAYAGEHEVLDHEDRPHRGGDHEEHEQGQVSRRVHELLGPEVGAEREHRPGQRRRRAADKVATDDQPPRHPSRNRHEAQERVGHVELGHTAEQHHRGDRHAVDAELGGREETGGQHPVGQPDGRGEAVGEDERQAVAQRGRQAAARRGLRDRGLVLLPDHRHGPEVNNQWSPRSGALAGRAGVRRSRTPSFRARTRRS